MSATSLPGPDADPAAPPARLAVSSAVFFVSQASGNIGYLAAVLLLAHAFPPSDRSIVAFTTVAVLLLVRISHFGVLEASSVFVASKPGVRRVLLANQLAFAAAASVAVSSVFVGALIFSGAHPAGASSGAIALVGLGTLVYAVYETLGTYLVGCGRSKTVALTYPIEGWGWAIGIIIVRELGALDPTVAVLAWILPLAAAGLIRLVSAVRVTGIARPDVRVLREGIVFGFPAWIGGVSSFANYRLDQILMGFISTSVQLGLYAVAVNGSEVLLYLATATAMALVPAVARSAPDVVAARALRAFRSVAVLTIGSTIVGLVTGPFLLPIVFGSNYEQSVTPFLVLALGAAGWTASVVLSSAMLGASAPRLSSVGAVVALSVGVAFDLLLIPRFGAVGAATATTVGSFAAGIAAAIVFTKHFDVRLRELVPGRRDVREFLATFRSLLRSLGRA